MTNRTRPGQTARAVRGGRADGCGLRGAGRGGLAACHTQGLGVDRITGFDPRLKEPPGLSAAPRRLTVSSRDRLLRLDTTAILSAAGGNRLPDGTREL